MTEAGLGRFVPDETGVSSPFVLPSSVTRVLGSNDEKGSPHSCEPFSHELSTRAFL